MEAILKNNLKRMKIGISFFVTLVVCMNLCFYSVESIANASDNDSIRTFKLTFDKFENDKMRIADNWGNEGNFNCIWKKENVSFSRGNMILSINDNTDDSGIEYSGAEYRSKETFGYGYYKVQMKPIKNDGVVSSFFVYTGPSSGTPWDEIDIEFLGKDTTKVQFNYFTDGVGKHEYIYDLGFDASEEFHTYAFRWLKDSISWYVDGVKVHTAKKNIPSTPGKIMMNVWPGIGVDKWLNEYDGKVPLKAEYKSMYFYEIK